MIAASRYFGSRVESITPKTEDAFFSGIRLANRTFKTTTFGRMGDLDAVVVRLACEREWRNPAVLDVGVSSGATTVDLLAAMLSNGLQPEITATDLTIDATILSFGPGLRMLTDRAGAPLQYEICGFGIRTWSRRLDFVTGYFLLTRLARNVATRLTKKHPVDVKLISRLRTASASKSINFLEDDLSIRNRGFETRFDIVRAANLLNLDYFETEKLRVMIENLKAYVRKPGGLIVINRTDEDATNHGTIFQMSNGGVRVLRRVGNGSEIESLVCP